MSFYREPASPPNFCMKGSLPLGRSDSAETTASLGPIGDFRRRGALARILVVFDGDLFREW